VRLSLGVRAPGSRDAAVIGLIDSRFLKAHRPLTRNQQLILICAESHFQAARRSGISTVTSNAATGRRSMVLYHGFAHRLLGDLTACQDAPFPIRFSSGLTVASAPAVHHLLVLERLRAPFPRFVAFVSSFLLLVASILHGIASLLLEFFFLGLFLYNFPSSVSPLLDRLTLVSHGFVSTDFSPIVRPWNTFSRLSTAGIA
jgi:hypothetical protein